MSDAPKEIWTRPDASGCSDEWKSGWWQGRPSDNYTESYTRTDLIQPMIDEALERAAQIVSRHYRVFGSVTEAERHADHNDMIQEIAAAIRALKGDQS